jgi:uncharacterized protein
MRPGALAVLIALVAHASAQAPDGAEVARDLMRAIQATAASPHETLTLTMTLTDSTGPAHLRETTIQQREQPNGRMARLIRFHTPPEMAGSAVLALENADRDDDWWIYLPAYHTTRRIPSVNRGDTYMGTDFSYEDLTDLRTDEYAFSLTGWAEVDGVRCRLLEARPQTAEISRHSIYRRRLYYVDPERLICPKVVLYGRDGEPLKEVRNARPVEIDGRWRWDRTELRNVRTGHRTLLEVREREWREEIPERIFSERSLRRPG